MSAVTGVGPESQVQSVLSTAVSCTLRLHALPARSARGSGVSRVWGYLLARKQEQTRRGWQGSL